jgi:putative nucleotidyltransferase with HDIG domain
MKNQLVQQIPEFQHITDVGLREKTLNCWVDALEQGKWTLDDLLHIPFTLVIPDCKVSFLHHVRAVTQVAMQSATVLSSFYADHYDLDFDSLVSGALLHDIGKLLEYVRTDEGYVKSPQGKLLRHPFSGAALAVKHGLPDKVVHMIATHAKEGDLGDRIPEAFIIHHADFMNFEPLKNL